MGGSQLFLSRSTKGREAMQALVSLRGSVRWATVSGEGHCSGNFCLHRHKSKTLGNCQGRKRGLNLVGLGGKRLGRESAKKVEKG